MKTPLLIHPTVFRSAILFFILQYCGHFANAQFTYQNAFSIGNTGSDNAYSIAADASGNYYVAGSFEFYVDMDPGPLTMNFTSVGGIDGFLAKYNSAGVFQWAISIGGSGDDAVMSVKIDPTNNVYITGSFESTIDFDPGSAIENHSSNGGIDIFLAKFDANGNFGWVNTFGGSESDNGARLAFDGNSNSLLLSGSFDSDSLNLDPNNPTYIQNRSTPFIESDIYVASYNPASGALQWAFGIGGTQSDRGQYITTDNSGNVFITGNFSNSNVDFDPGAATQYLSSAGSADIFIAKYNSSGIYQWAQRIGANGGEKGFAIACDNNGNIYTGGYFNSDSVDFDPGAGTHYLFTNGVQDLFVLKLDNAGVFQWVFSAGALNSETVQDIMVSATDDVFISGNFGNTVDFDPGPDTFELIGAPAADAYLAQYDADGNFVDAFALSGNGYEFGLGLCALSANKLGWTGYFSTDTIDLDPGAGLHNLMNSGTSTTWPDIFVASYGYTSIGIDEVSTAGNQFYLYPNPTRSELTIRLANTKTPALGKLNEISILNVLGEIVYSSGMESIQSAIDVSKFESGIYFIQMKIDKTISTQKFIKQ